MGTQLHPIKVRDLDLQQYLLVKSVMMIRSLKAYKNYSCEFPFEEFLHIKELSDQLKDDYAYLIYPSLHRQFRMYPQELTQYPAMIAVFEKRVSRIERNDKDVYYVLKNFYTLDRENTEGSRLLAFNAHSVDVADEGLPVFHDNTDELLSAMDGLLELMEASHFEDNEWYQRLTDSRQMIVQREDGLRLLHNLGLYDCSNLRHALSAAGVMEAELQEVFSFYTDSVKVFAMSVVNGVYEKTYIEPVVKRTRAVEPVKPVVAPQRPKMAPQPPVKPKPSSPPKSNPLYKQESRNMRWRYRQQILQEMEQKQNEVNVQPEPVKNHTDEQREEKNATIRRNVLWYIAAMLALVGAAWLVKYSVTGSATISVGVISAIIIRNLHRLKTGYEYSEAHPRWFVLTLVFTALFGTLFGFLVCKWFSDYVYDATHGTITPWGLWGLMAVMMAAVYWYSREQRKKKTGKAKRPYTFLMVVSVCLVVSQCVGSISSSRHIDQRQWEKSYSAVETIDEGSENMRYETMLVGTWVRNADVLGARQVVDEFRADGSWQQGSADGIQSKGNWSYLGNGEIRIQETWVVVGEMQSTSANEWILRIDNLQDDEMTVQKGNLTVTYKRMKTDSK